MTDSRTLRRAAWGIVAGALVLAPAGCAAPGTTPRAPGPSPAGGETSTQGGTTPLVQATWPVRTREHVDLWLHSYALLTADSTLVPYFKRGYRDRLLEVRRQRGVSTQLDASRARLLERIAVQPSLATGPQFLPFYFGSWEQMRQAVDVFIRANGNPRATSDPTLQQYIAILAGSFQSAADREWLRLLVVAVDDESRKFHRDYWTAETRARAAVVAHVDSLWQRSWRPSLQRFLNNTQQQNGEIYLSLPLDGEGRTVNFGKVQNAVAVGMPDAIQGSESVLYTFAHEVAGSVANTAIVDNTTPADRRAGTTARFEQSAAVRAGALLLERTLPSAVPGYMRFYLQSAGRTAPGDPRAAFASTFAVPDAVNEAIGRQLEVILGGI
ncbi:MAG TPA: hypothetical protein VFS59_11345 [Gemmatimonadaceae bacterium]|nr:hypothetical protein [Gemmatimonadaceae bacterium]